MPYLGVCVYLHRHLMCNIIRVCVVAQEGMVRKFTVVGSEVTDVNGTYTENGKTDG